MQYKSVPLYGGAITVDLPTAYHDASLIREVPDHQELYLDENGYSGVIFEILEYVEKDSDAEALQVHFADLVGGTGDRTSALDMGVGRMERVGNTPIQTLTFIQTPTTPPPTPRKTPDFVAIYLLLLRLKQQASDILITVNVPHYAGEYEPAGAGEEGKTGLMREGEEVVRRVAESFDVRDWGLFEG